MEYKIEHDSLGEIKVDINKYWGAQTQRSFENFHIGSELIPEEIIKAFAIIKKASANTNYMLGILDKEKAELISQVCYEILSGRLQEHFPLHVWQTGSGTQSNMNVNEVIANRANQMAGKKVLHPNDDVNMSQSSNDTFPTAMHIAAVYTIENNLIPVLKNFVQSLQNLENENFNIIKTGRTHLMDATPIRFSQEISGWRGMIENNIEQIVCSLDGLRRLALGGTAVGTGINAPKDFAEKVATEITKITGTKFTSSLNKFHALTSKDDIVFAHGALKALAANMMKIANDVRWLSSGPRCGLGEISIPANEPGSSIMPGKVNPTQAEAITMIAIQVFGNDTTIGFAASQGNFELNVFMPVTIYNFLQSVRLLSDGIKSFNTKCVSGIKANKEVMEHYNSRSLMNATFLNPYIGYENAAKAVKYAYEQNVTIKDAVIALGMLDEQKASQIFACGGFI